MAATKNAHDWHCEDHDTYGWRGEECRKCPTAPSEADALRNELNRLVDLCRQIYEAERDKNQQDWTAAIRALEKVGADKTAWRILTANAELCGGPSGPSERAPG